MNSYEQLKLDIITRVFSRKLPVKEAALILNKSPRTIERYLSRYKKIGARFVKHSNSIRTPVNKISQDLERQVKYLIKSKYFDFNILHLLEILKTNENIIIKRETLRKWSHQIQMTKRKKRRSPAARFKRQRMSQRGILIQMDGSTHQWFGNQKSCLISTIDDATSEILWAEFFHSEDIISCMSVLKKVIELHGLFKVLYVDHAGLYGGPKRVEFSQIKRAMEELGINIIFANSAQAKGRIERSFNTLQDRLIPELRLRGITTFMGANDYLQNSFIPMYWNKRLVVPAENPESCFKPIGDRSIEDIMCIKEYRKINLDHTFSYKSEFYLIEKKFNHSLARQQIEIRTRLDLQVRFFYGLTEIAAKRIAPLYAATAA